MALYNYDKKLSAAERKVENAAYSENSKKLILRFEKFLFVEGLSKARVIKYLSQMNAVAEWADFELDSATKEDIEYIVGLVARSELADWTKYGYLIAVKRFYRWLNGGDDPDITKWIKPKVKHPSKLPEELLTEDDVKKMINSVEHPRDKALIATFWDAGGRTGELGNLLIKHIVFDKYGAVAVVDGKTGMRRVRLIFCVPHLATWLDMHPEKDNPNAPLWVGIGQRGKGKPLSYASIRMLIKRSAKKARVFRYDLEYGLDEKLTTDVSDHYPVYAEFRVDGDLE